MHISDIEGEFIPRKGDKVRYQVCPMPPRFDKPQGVHIQIIDFTPERHRKWSEKETPEDLAEDAAAIKEEKEMNETLKGPGPLTPEMISPRRRPSSGGYGLIEPVQEENGTHQCINVIIYAHYIFLSLSLFCYIEFLNRICPVYVHHDS